MIRVDKFSGLAGELEAAAGLQDDLARLMAEREELRDRFDGEAAAIEEAMEEVQAPRQMVLEALARRLTEIEHQMSAVLSAMLNKLVEPETDP